MNPAIPLHIWHLFTTTQTSERDAAATHPEGSLQLATRLAESASRTVPVRALAHHILRHCSHVEKAPSIVAMWIRSNLRYWRETPGVEVLSGPVSTILSGGGDCDDLAILHASLLRSIGVTAYPAAMGNGVSWAHMVSWCPPLAPFELCLEYFYSTGDELRTPLQRGQPANFLAWDDARGHFIEPAITPKTQCPTCPR